MAAYGPQFKAGAYSVTYDSDLLGYTEAGFEFIIRPSANIIRLDPSGHVPIDALWTGVEDIVVRLESMEFSYEGGTSGRINWPKAIPYLFYNTNALTEAAADEGNMLQAGRLLVAGSFAKTLVLTPVTPNIASPVYTFTAAFPLEPVRTVFSSQRLRSVPFGFYCFANANFDATSLVPELYAVTSATPG